jgi:hypothetical protein
VTVVVEHVKLSEAGDRAAGIEAKGRDLNIAVRSDRQAFRAARSIRQDREDIGVAAIKGFGGRLVQHRQKEAGARSISFSWCIPQLF